MKKSEYFVVLDKLIKENGITIDRQKGTAHPRYPDLVYPNRYSKK